MPISPLINYIIMPYLILSDTMGGNYPGKQGEVVPVSKEPGSTVVSGTVLQEGYLEVEVSALAQDSTIKKLENIITDVQVS